MADLNVLVIEKSIEHWPVFAGVGMMLFAMWRWIIPNAVRSSLEDGGGDAVRKVVKSELNEQDDRIDEKLENQNEKIESKLRDFDQSNKDRILEMMSKHEEVERITIQNIMLKLKNETDTSHVKLLQTIEELNDRTTHIERKLKMKRRSNQAERTKE